MTVAALAELQAIPLSEAMICLDCKTISNSPAGCPGCGSRSAALWRVDRLLKETTVNHSQDSDCTVNPETNCCYGCGVEHGDPCPVCGGRGYHRADCGNNEG